MEGQLAKMQEVRIVVHEIFNRIPQGTDVALGEAQLRLACAVLCVDNNLFLPRQHVPLVV
jgi:hypothetical protein